MSCLKLRTVTTLLLSIAALLMAVSSSTAAQTTTTPSVSVLHFTDGGDDLPERMTTDAAGNIYVSAGIKGSGFAVLKYNSQNKLHIFRYKNQPGEFQGRALAVKLDTLGNIYAVGDTTLGGLVVSFTPAGTQRWATRFNGIAIAVAIDAAGNVYVAGSSQNGPPLEWVIVKYSNSGAVLWEQHHTGTVGEDSIVTDLQLDPSGNPVVLGTTSNSLLTLTNNMTVLKFDPQGNTLWTQDFAVAHVSQVPGGLAIDRRGNVYATSLTDPPEGIDVPFTVKYNSNGVRKFVLQGNGAGGSSIAIDRAGDILLTGATINFGTPVFIAATKIHPSGARVWVSQIAATGKIASDSAGNVFVAGTPDFLITKLNAAGTVLFTSSLLPRDNVTDAVVDPFDNLLVTGSGVNAQFEDDIFTVRLK